MDNQRASRVDIVGEGKMIVRLRRRAPGSYEGLVRVKNGPTLSP